MQTKLTTEQIGKLKQARNGIRSVLVQAIDHQGAFWIEVLGFLDDKIKHGTSDGKPWVEPEPEIPEGWRKAEPDEWQRKDVQFWHKTEMSWMKRPCMGDPFDPLACGTRYIVPIDPPLTDEDACVWPRLLVMVRDDGSAEWKGPYRYKGKDDDITFPFVAASYYGKSQSWKQARRATPAEIEAANGNS